MKHLSLTLFAVTIFLCSACQDNFDQRCAQEAAEYTKTHCPQQVEEGNTLDSLSYNIETRTYQYYYTLSGRWTSPANIASLQQQKEILRGYLLDKLNNSLELNACKKEGINFSYKYYSASTKKEVVHILLTPADYKIYK